MLGIDEHPLNVLSPIVLTPFGIITAEASFEQD
jgi:hypothetical protein